MRKLSFVLFERSAVEFLASRREYQSTEYPEGKALVDYLCGEENPAVIRQRHLIVRETGKGLLFIGSKFTKTILVIDLETCELIEKEKDEPYNMLYVVQRMFRAALKAWDHQPFSGMERTSDSKIVLFPFPYNVNKRNNKRLVIEREIESHRLKARGIEFPLLAYKYNDEEYIEGSDKKPDTSNIDEAGKSYVDLLPSFSVERGEAARADVSDLNGDIYLHKIFQGDGGYKYLNFELQYANATYKQKEVIDYNNLNKPIRIVGPAGTGKTTSMILRAYKMLLNARADNRLMHILFITHSESTRYENEEAFLILEDAKIFLTHQPDPDQDQTIEFITLLSYCRRYRNISDLQLIDNDAAEAKIYQRELIKGAYDKVRKRTYKSYREYLSSELRDTLEETHDEIICQLLQHEFSIQIKGKADGQIEKYKDVKSLKNGLPVSEDIRFKDKDYIFSAYLEYESLLRGLAVYDTDDITIEALMSLNAPIWRRERAQYGYDYIFVDEVHLFNLNEQHVFHFLTKSAAETSFCFALDYGQAIGDRGDLSDSYIENSLTQNAQEFDYKTVFRSSRYITEFCVSLVESGVLLFRSNFINSYHGAQPASTIEDELSMEKPRLCMADTENDMLNALKVEIDKICKGLEKCKNYQIAIVSFDNNYVTKDKILELQGIVGRNIYYLEGRNVGGLSAEVKEKNAVILTTPQNVNGLEFRAVILLGVDGARVPPQTSLNDSSRNYLRYNAYNMLYLSVSRARERVTILGNKQNRESECLAHSLENKTLMRA